MTSDAVSVLRAVWLEATGASYGDQGYSAAVSAEFDRFIARVKADALREAAEDTRSEAPDEPWAGATFRSYAEWLEHRADRIEEEGL